MVGKDFTHKAVTKITIVSSHPFLPLMDAGDVWVHLELIKRLEKDLLFYYHTSTQQCFFEGEHPNFSQPPDKPLHSASCLKGVVI